jgi:hypothetical protein
MGELFRAMVALDDMMRRGPPRPLWVDVPPSLHEAVKRFAIRGLALRDLAGRPCDYDVGSLCTATPARPRARRS